MRLVLMLGSTVLSLLGPFAAQASTLTYWNVFNLEEETSLAADIVTYATLGDMLADTNRTSVNTLPGFGTNIVDSGSDGTTYWNIFNLEEETSLAADIVTYATLGDMLADTNRTSVNTLPGFGANIVGSGSDGKTYWSVFNLEEETSLAADIVTYATLGDMLADTNRTSVNTLSGFGANIVGSGASGVPPAPIPIPASVLLLGAGLCALTLTHRRARRRNENS